MDMDMENPLIQTINLVKYFNTPGGKLHAVDGINLSINRGETLGVVGESGCGKSTLGRTILRLIEPTSGQVLYNGIDVLKLNNRQMADMRRKMQIIFQDPYASLDPKMKAEDILLEPLLANKVYKEKEDGRKKVRELLETVGLNETHMKRYPYQFSGGQRQRIGIARALALEPAFIACDEPVSALDVSVQAQILNLLKDIQSQRNLSLLFISHDLGVVRYIADRVVIMYLGRICEIGPVEEVYNHPKHPYTEYLIRSVPKMRLPNPEERNKKETVREANEIIVEKRENMCPFYSRCKYRTSVCQEKYPEQQEENGTKFFCHHHL